MAESRLDDAPTLDEIEVFETQWGDIDVTQRIGTDNEQFGINLLEDDDGSIVNDIKGDGLHKIPLITLEIVRMWLRGIGKKPVTWATLVGVLERIRLRALATEIRESPQVKLGSKPKLDQFTALQTKRKKVINVFVKISTDYERFGTRLLEDDDGTLVDSVKGTTRHTRHVTRDIVIRWLSGAGRQPVTWQTMINVLNEIRLTELASSLHKTLCGDVPDTTPRPIAGSDPSASIGGPKMPRGSTLSDSPGVAILITCDYRENHEMGSLPGTRADAEAMKETFEFLQYIVFERHNPTESEIRDLLKEVASLLAITLIGREEAKEKVIVFAFSGHGTTENYVEKIYANDGGKLELQDEIILPLTRFADISGVPKLFFIDACRGGETLYDLEKGAGPSSAAAQADTKGGTKKSDAQVAKSNQVFVEKLAFQVAGNYCVCYATIPNHVSYATTVGSRWMPVLAHHLREKNDSFQHIIGGVMSYVGGLLKDNKQQCNLDNRLNVCPLYLQKRE